MASAFKKNLETPAPATEPKPKLTVVTASKAHIRRDRARSVAVSKARNAVFICDEDWNIEFGNDSALDLLASMEPSVRAHGTQWKSFDSRNVEGKNISFLFADEPQEFRNATESRSHPYSGRLSVGPYTVDMYVDSLTDEKGQLLGYLVDWVDHTDSKKKEELFESSLKQIAERIEFLSGACSTDLSTAMQALANGDLTIRITPRTPLLDIPDEPNLASIAHSFNSLRNQTVKSVEAYNQALESLSTLVAQSQVAATNINDASAEVMTGNDDLAQRTEQQAASLEETASSMEQMTSTVKQNADNAKQANQLAVQAREAAEKGGQVVGGAVATMQEINVASKRIADIISVIDEIAFQTNLLALNAAVEAARVGEQGRGFAVVAAEVRNLAGRSATAAKEIKALVQDSVQKVQEGSNQVNESGKTLDDIVTSVKKVADIIAEITAAAQEQSAGIEQVNKAISQMDQITQQNAALVEEASAASQSMNRQATDLQSMVGKFTLKEEFLTKLRAANQADLSPAVGPSRRSSTSSQPGRRFSADAKQARIISKPTNDDLDDFEEF